MSDICRARRGAPGLPGLLLVALALGCSEPPSTPATPGDYTRREGDGCADAADECIDAVSLWQCEDRVWRVTDCSEVCATRGGVVGCLSMIDGARCWCADDVPACIPGQAHCGSDLDEIRICDPQALQFYRESCEVLCDVVGPAYRSLGCSEHSEGHAECTCTLEGTPCSPDNPPHCERFALARCVDGVWVLEPCVCDTGIASCDPFGETGAECVCN